jgi:hypothetical protein
LERQSVRFLSDFILHTAYTVDACAHTRMLSPLSFTDVIYCTADTKATAASVSIFRFIWILLLHNVVKRVHNRTARFRCLFSSTDGYGV